jgi:hypothetical protein
MLDNKRNLQYFEAPSMRELFDVMQTWQAENKQRFLSLNVEQEGDSFCCIALTNPSEVIIVDGSSLDEGAAVHGQKLRVDESRY